MGLFSRRQEIQATFGNEVCLYDAVERLGRIEGTKTEVLDRRRLKVIIRKDRGIQEKVISEITGAKGYVDSIKA